jgi:hypothetical protein
MQEPWPILLRKTNQRRPAEAGRYKFKNLILEPAAFVFNHTLLSIC